MATLVKDPLERSPFWYACYTAADGRRLKKSTRETSKSRAQIIADALQRAEDWAAERTLTETRARELLSEVLQRVTGQSLRMFTVRQWFDHFVKMKRKSRSAKTASRHKQMMDEFCDFLGKRADLNIAAITSRDVAEFRDRRESSGLSASTLNIDIKILSAAFNSALRQGYISVNPCLAIEPMRNRATHKDVFSVEQVQALLKMADGDWKGAILTAFYTGARLSDVCSLRWRNVDLASKTIVFEQRKTGEQVTVAVHEALEEFLLSLSAPARDKADAFLFPQLARFKSASPLSKEFRRIMEKAKIQQKLLRERNKSGRSVHALSFHSLRHSFASLLANSGVSEELRMRLTGHATRELHQRYTHHDLKALQSAIAVLPRIVGK